ncbi:MAG: isopentenyl-diphosphate Delta-isomerase [Paracoccaceae bacterium]
MNEMIPAWEDGVLTPVEKLQVHRRGLRHKAVSVFVVQGSRILLQRRALSKYHTPGLWANTCCTHPRWNESPAECAVRRLEEELGITGLELTHRGQVEYRADVGAGLVEHEVVEIYLARVTVPLTITPNPAEVTACVWVEIEDLLHRISERPETFTPWLRIYLADHLDVILGPYSG